MRPRSMAVPQAGQTEAVDLQDQQAPQRLVLACRGPNRLPNR